MRKHKERYLNSADIEIVEALKRWQRTPKGKLLRTEQEAKKLRNAAEQRARHKARREENFEFAISATSEAFYRSTRWKEIRFQAIQKYGRKCRSCGATPEGGATIHVDHIKPRSIYPEFAFSIHNLQILCSECNMGKGISSTRVVTRKAEPSQRG